MTSHPERLKLMQLINEATDDGARKKIACHEVGISIRTFQRWSSGSEVQCDRRPTAIHATPLNKLSDDERQQILDICCRLEFANLPPSQIVPILADRGEYIASESTFYRVLKEENLLHH